MTIRLVPVKSFSNPNLPMGDFSSLLNRPEALGVYEMLGTYDASGNGKNLKMGGHTFNQLGLVSKPVKGFYVDTGILEPDVFTVVVATNINNPSQLPIPGSIPNIISSFSEVAAPFSGHRLALTSSGIPHLAVGKTSGSPIQALSGNTAIGGWTVYAYTVDGKKLALQRSSGVVVNAEGAESDIKSPAKRTICIAGNPTTDTVTGATTMPPDGVIGCLGIYAGDFGVGGRAQLINDATSIMKKRGVM
ncbi:hypothetical protein CHUUTOTORO_00030 [Serratia phage vB_SmaM-ChuuTotoro]|nr:hypothetical protein CHUUTOTORO_00030 [Serratia phage vB_SmaM-ChuuTotoro]